MVDVGRPRRLHQRVQAAIKAVTADKATLDVKIVQLVKLLRNGEPVKM